MKNVGPREGGSITAAQFLERFVDDGVHWAHLDIAGMVWADKPSHLCDKGATGFGVRLLDHFVARQSRRLTLGEAPMQVDFYQLGASAARDRCSPRIAEQAARRRTSGCWSSPRTRRCSPGSTACCGTRAPTSFLPHGLAGGADDARQPILLSTSPDAPNLRAQHR